MSFVDTDVWTCPLCQETVRGPSRTRRTQQRTHARRHQNDPTSIVRPPKPLVVPAAPKNRRRVR